MNSYKLEPHVYTTETPTGKRAVKKTYREIRSEPRPINDPLQAPRCFAQLPQSRGVQRWQPQEKNPKTKPCSSVFVPPEQLAEFLASGLTVNDFISSTPNPSVPLPKPKQLKLNRAASFQQSDKPKLRIERNAVEAYRAIAKGIEEVPVEAGRIDYLTETELIEFKVAQGWKHAIGQLLVYGHYFPQHKLVLMLVGQEAKFYQPMATLHCSRLNIEVRTTK